MPHVAQLATSIFPASSNARANRRRATPSVIGVGESGYIAYEKSSTASVSTYPHDFAHVPTIRSPFGTVPHCGDLARRSERALVRVRAVQVPCNGVVDAEIAALTVVDEEIAVFVD